MGWITRSFSGEEELWKVIWIYGVLFVFFAKVAGVLLHLATDIDFDNPTAVQLSALNAAKVTYGIWFLVSAWRCAFNADGKFWGYLVRLLVILYILLFCAAYFMISEIFDPFELLNRLVHFARVWANIEK